MGHSSGGSSSWQHPNSSSRSSSNEYHSNSSSQSSSEYQKGNGNAYNAYNTNQTAQKQAQYNEANTFQKNNENTEKQLQNKQDATINNNAGDTNYYGGGSYGPYNDCCSDGDGGSSTGEALGAAALGAVGGMAVGSMMTANAQSQTPSTTIIENNPPYGYQPASYGTPAVGSTVYSLPAGAFSTTVNGSTYYSSNGVYYKPFYSGSQVVYIVSQP